MSYIYTLFVHKCFILLIFTGVVLLAQAEFTARLVNELSQEIQKALEYHPQNIQRKKEVGFAVTCRSICIFLLGLKGLYLSSLTS